MFRPFHYSEMIRKHSDVDDWNKVMKKSWSFNRGWGEDRRILFWVALFCVLAGLGFLMCAICLLLATRDKVLMAKVALGTACFAGVLLACFAIDYLWTSKNHYKNYALKDLNNNLLTALLVLLIIGIVLLVVNAVLNCLRQRSSHFVFGVVLIVWLFIFVCILGLILRDMRKRQFKGINNPGKCASIMDSLHSEDIKKACPNKYLNQACTKDYLVNKWEDNSGHGFLNPACCQSVQNHLLWPLYICGCLCLLLVTAVLVAIAYNFYLADKSEYLEFSENRSAGILWAFAGLCLIALIAFGIYWCFRPKDKVPRSNPNNPDVVYSKYTNGVTGLKDDKFEVVDLHKVYGGSVPAGAYTSNPLPQSGNSAVAPGSNPQVQASQTSNLQKMRTGNQIMTVKLNRNLCKAFASTCGMRIGVLAENGKLSVPPSKIRGNSLARKNFFDDNYINNDFQLVYGTEADLNSYLAQLHVTPYDLSKTTTVFFNAEQVNLSDLQNSGLKSGET